MGNYLPLCWGQSIYINYLEFFCMGCLFSTMYCVYSVAYISMISGIFYTLGYNTVLFYSVVQIVPALAIGSSFSWLWCNPWMWVFCLSTFLFLARQDASGSFAYLLPWPRMIYFSKEPWYFLLESNIRNQEVSARCAHCYWSVIPSRPFQLTRARRYMFAF